MEETQRSAREKMQTRTEKDSEHLARIKQSINALVMASNFMETVQMKWRTKIGSRENPRLREMMEQTADRIASHLEVLAEMVEDLDEEEAELGESLEEPEATQGEFHFYVAYGETFKSRSRIRITTVFAENFEGAQNRVFEELSKPGREPYLEIWERGGRLVLEEAKKLNVQEQPIQFYHKS